MRRQRKRVAPDAKLALGLSRDERNLVVHNWSVSRGLQDEQLQALRVAEKPEWNMTLADWDEFAGWVAATGNHARSGSSLRRRADHFFDRIQREVLDPYGEA